jgi:hypothetical protein
MVGSAGVNGYVRHEAIAMPQVIAQTLRVVVLGKVVTTWVDAWVTIQVGC